MVVGVFEGYKKELEIVGVGYCVIVIGQLFEFVFGYFYLIVIEFLKEIKVIVDIQKGKVLVVMLELFDK